MQLVPAGQQCSFEVTYDLPGLDVAMSVFDVSASPVLVSGPAAMANVVGSTYYGKFTPLANKQYVIHKAVYTDGSFSTLSPDYSQASESIVAEPGLPGDVVKNTALPAFEFPMVDGNSNPVTGLLVTAKRSIDGGALVACANPVTEIGSGIYRIDLAASDLNGGVIGLQFTATGARAQTVTIVTRP